MKRLRHLGLRAKIIAWSFIPAAIILGVVALAHFLTFQQLTEDLVADRNRDLARLLADQYAVELEALAQPLQVLANNPDIMAFNPAAQQLVLRAARDDLWGYDAGVVITDAHGHVTAADNRRQDLLGVIWADQPVLARMTESRTLSVSGEIIAPDAERPQVALSVPVFDRDGGYQGMLVGMFAVGRSEARITDFYGTIKKLLLKASGTAYLVDGTGRVIFHPDTWQIGQPGAAQAAITRALAGETGTLRDTNRDGHAIMASYAPVPGTDWAVIVEEQWAALTAASVPYQRLLLALLALGLIVPAAVVAAGTRRVTRPVHDLIRGAQAIAGGDFSRRITPRSHDEIEELTEQFNRMAGHLQESYATLEQRVEDRTRELAALNTIAAVASQSLDLKAVLQAALDKILAVTGVAVGAAYRLGADGETLQLIAQRGLPEEFVILAQQLPRTASVAGHIDQSLSPALLAVSDYPDGPLKNILTQCDVQIALGIPLVAKRQILGFINLGSSTPRPWPPEELALMAAIGQQVAVAVENARLYEQAEEAAAQAERSRLARDLHDAVSQTLFSASMIAGVLPRLWERDPDYAREQLAQLQQLTRGAQAEMRILLLELRPDALVETTLPDLLSQLAQATGSRAMAPVEVEIEGTCAPPLEVKVALYRIAQEALNNVVKHAEAEHVTLTLHETARTLTLTVRDDGCGFDARAIPKERLGQRSMRERAESIGAQLTVTSAPQQGTQVFCRWVEGDDTA